MSDATPATPGPDLLVTPVERERAQDVLADAYAEGRVTEADFDRRLDQVLSARNRRDLNAAFFGLVEPPAERQPGPVELDATSGRTVAALTHLSGMFSLVLGPLVVWGLSARGSYVRREAIKAFSFQAFSLIAAFGSYWALGHLIVPAYAGVLGAGGRNVPISILMLVLWVTLTVAGALNAATGGRWRDGFTKVLSAARHAVDQDASIQPKTTGG